MTRIYPCSECAKHFGDLVRYASSSFVDMITTCKGWVPVVPCCRKSPPQTGSGEELQQWLCMAHNNVNQSIGKPAFNCSMASMRWGALDCGSELVCSMHPGQ